MNVLLVGDSQLAGPMGVQMQQMFEAEGDTVTRWGEVGWTADSWIANRWPDVTGAVAGQPPVDLIVYVLGTNDIYRADRTTPSAITLRDVGPETWFVGAPNYNDPNLTARVNGTKPIFQTVFGDHYIDSRQYTAPTCTGRTPDCIHFVSSSGLGQQWGRGVFNELKSKRSGSSVFSGSTTSMIGWGFLAAVVAVAGGVVWYRSRDS